MALTPSDRSRGARYRPSSSDAPTLQYWEAKQGNRVVQVVGPIFRPEKYGIALAEGSAVRKTINAALLQLYVDGTYEEIYARWFLQNQ